MNRSTPNFLAFAACLLLIAPCTLTIASAQVPSPAAALSPTVRYSRCPDAQPYIDLYNDAYSAIAANLGNASVEAAKRWKLSNDRLVSAMERCATRLHDKWKTQVAPPYEYDSIRYAGYLREEVANLDIFAMQVDWELKGDKSQYVAAYSGESFEKMLYFEASHACLSVQLATSAMMVSSDGTPVEENAWVAGFLTRLSTIRIKLDDMIHQYLPDEASILSCNKDP